MKRVHASSRLSSSHTSAIAQSRPPASVPASAIHVLACTSKRKKKSIAASGSSDGIFEKVRSR